MDLFFIPVEGTTVTYSNSIFDTTISFTGMTQQHPFTMSPSVLLMLQRQTHLVYRFRARAEVAAIPS